MLPLENLNKCILILKKFLVKKKYNFEVYSDIISKGFVR